jgi:hypothetical protein
MPVTMSVTIYACYDLCITLSMSVTMSVSIYVCYYMVNIDFHVRFSNYLQASLHDVVPVQVLDEADDTVSQRLNHNHALLSAR